MINLLIMPYFTKYIPTGEEIRFGLDYEQTGKKTEVILTPDGIRHIAGTNNETLWCREDMEMNWTYSKWYDIKDCKKVKLYLCNRDIQVGDDIWFTSLIDNKLKQGKFYHLTKGNEGEDIVDLTPDGEGTGFELGSGIGFKVIGEISSDATWVKEGDEYDEDDVQICFKNRPPADPFPWKLMYDWERETLPNQTVENTIVFIKGCCGHHH